MSNLIKVLEYLERNLDLNHIKNANEKTKNVISYKSDEYVVVALTPEIPENFSAVPTMDRA